LRQLGSIILHKVAGFAVNAAFTAPNGLSKNGTAGTLDGNDGSPIGSCSVAQSENLAGLAVPPGGNLTVIGGKGKGGQTGNDFLGNPPVDSTSTSAQMLADTGIDWQGLLDGSFAQADYTYSSDGWPNFSTGVASDEWPLILVDTGSLQLEDWMSGRGTIVLQGNAIATGDFNWDGLILVGGQYTSNGIQDVDGAVITGLNELLGASNIPPSNLGNGTWTYQYDACNVLNALKGIGWPVEEPGTWVEIM
jgi:hypothetical protein